MSGEKMKLTDNLQQKGARPLTSADHRKSSPAGSVKNGKLRADLSLWRGDMDSCRSPSPRFHQNRFIPLTGLFHTSIQSKSEENGAPVLAF